MQGVGYLGYQKDSITATKSIDTIDTVIIWNLQTCVR